MVIVIAIKVRIYRVEVILVKEYLVLVSLILLAITSSRINLKTK